MLGEIVHNEDVLRDIEKTGIMRIRRFSRKHRGATLLISAHGVADGVLARAREYGYRIVDATCPMVKSIHRTAAAMDKDGRRVIVIGDPDHDEVKGIAGSFRKTAIIVVNPGAVNPGAVDRRLAGIKRAGVVSQSTQELDQVEKTVAGIGRLIPDMTFSNTICRPTRVKQKEIAGMARENDAIVIIGSSGSANTRRLYEIAKSINKRAYWVRSADEVKPVWLRGVRSVGVGAGASTPDAVTIAVVARLNEIGSRR